MPYRNTKVYYDGSHYIAIPPDNFPSYKRKRHKQKPPQQSITSTPKEKFKSAYTESQQLPKRERKKYIAEKLKGEFETSEQVTEFIEKNIERENTNAMKRRTRLMRKVYLQRWNYCSPEMQRLHFHGIFYIPQMIGEIIEVKDYSTKSHRMQTTYQNSHFLKHFGRNDFKVLERQEDIMQSVKYLLKYIGKSSERLIYGGKLPTYFRSDILDEDIACGYGVDERKLLLFDNFQCIDEGVLMGKVSPEIIAQMPKCN